MLFLLVGMAVANLADRENAVQYLHIAHSGHFIPGHFQLVFVSFSSGPAHLSLSQQNTRAGCSGYKYCALNESPSGCHSAFKPIPVRCCLCVCCPAYWTSDFVAWKTFPALVFTVNVVTQCYTITVTKYRCAIKILWSIFFTVLPGYLKRSEIWRYLCRMHVKSGTKQAFSGSLTKLSAGQQAFFLHPLSHEPLLLGQSPLCMPMALG